MKHVIFALAATLTAAPAFADTPPPPPEAPVTIQYEQVCSPMNLTLYFSGDSAEISTQARSALESAVDQLDGCAVTQMRATTVSSDAGAGQDLLILSEARSDSVLEAFASAGVWASDIQTDIILARSTNRPDTALEPLARRVEIELTTVRPITS